MGGPPITGDLSDTSHPGCSRVSPGLCSPPAPAQLKQHEPKTYHEANQRDECTDILAPSFHPRSPTWYLQSGVTSAFWGLSHPPLCLASEICVCVCVFFLFKGLFFSSGCVRPVAWRQASYSSLSLSVQISSLSLSLFHSYHQALNLPPTKQ